MSRLSRYLKATLREIKREEASLRERVMSAYDYFVEALTPDIYYSIKNYLQNIFLFNRLAWSWRCWDSHFTISVFAKLLLENGKACRDGWSVDGKKRYIKACIIAHNLEKAYNYNCTDDKAFINFVRKYRPHVTDNRFYRGYDKGSREEKLYNTINKRIDATEAKLKKEAWEQVHKYIEYFWD